MSDIILEYRNTEKCPKMYIWRKVFIIELKPITILRDVKQWCYIGLMVPVDRYDRTFLKIPYDIRFSQSKIFSLRDFKQLLFTVYLSARNISVVFFMAKQKLDKNNWKKKISISKMSFSKQTKKDIFLLSSIGIIPFNPHYLKLQLVKVATWSQKRTNSRYIWMNRTCSLNSSLPWFGCQLPVCISSSNAFPLANT